MGRWWDVLDVAVGVFVGVGSVIATMNVLFITLSILAYLGLVWLKDDYVIPMIRDRQRREEAA